MNDTHNFHRTIAQPIPLGAVSQVLSDLSILGWEPTTIIPVTIQTSKLAGAQPESAAMLIVHKTVKIGTVPDNFTVKMTNEGIEIVKITTDGANQ